MVILTIKNDHGVYVYVKHFPNLRWTFFSSQLQRCDEKKKIYLEMQKLFWLFWYLAEAHCLIPLPHTHTHSVTPHTAQPSSVNVIHFRVPNNNEACVWCPQKYLLMLNICLAVCSFALLCSSISQGRYCLSPTVCCRWAASNTWCSHTGRAKVCPLRAVFYGPSAGLASDRQSQVRDLLDSFLPWLWKHGFCTCVLWFVSPWVCFNPENV